jgi:hypothetical protein
MEQRFLATSTTKYYNFSLEKNINIPEVALMKKYLMFVFLIILLSVSTVILAQTQSKVIKAYLTVNYNDKAIANKDISKANIEEKIKNALSLEGIQIIPNGNIGKPGESILDIL